jgi:hypothetical protein
MAHCFASTHAGADLEVVPSTHGMPWRKNDLVKHCNSRNIIIMSSFNKELTCSGVNIVKDINCPARAMVCYLNGRCKKHPEEKWLST